MTTERDLIQRLITAIEGHCHENTISHDLNCAYIEACDFLATHEPAAGPTDEELDDLYYASGGVMNAFARAVLARWGHQLPAPEVGGR